MEYANIHYDDLLENIYLDWRNNFSTIAGFASYYGISEQVAGLLISAARIHHDDKNN